MSLFVERVVGDAIAGHLLALAKLRIEVFREFPYLYEGSLEYEQKYLASYARSDAHVVVLAHNSDRIVGASTAMPIDRDHEVASALAGFDLSTICYFGESVLTRAYRGRGLGRAFFEERIAHARERGFRIATFCAVDRPIDHPARPADYRPLDALWTKQGFERKPEITTTFTWRDVGDDRETPKRMVFWMRDL